MNLMEQVEKICINDNIDEIVNLCGQLTGIISFEDALCLLKECVCAFYSNNLSMQQ